MITDREFNELKQIYPVLLELPPTLRQAVQVEGWRVVAARGQHLFDLHEHCQAFLMIVRGVLWVTKPTLVGRNLLLYRLTPGDTCILTVSCLLGQADYPAVGMVQEDLLGYAVPRSLFSRLLEQSSAFREFIFRFFAGRIAELMELVEVIGFQPLERRLAAVLSRRGPLVHITHQSLADEVGSVREVVSRVLKDFERRSILRLERGQIHVLDDAALRRIADPLGDQDCRETGPVAKPPRSVAA